MSGKRHKNFTSGDPDACCEVASPDIPDRVLAGGLRMWALGVGVDDPLFIAVAHSAKVRCIVCDRQGDQTNGTGWQQACLLGHAPCPGCGKIIGLTPAGRVRQSHAGCPSPNLSAKPVPAAAPRYQPRVRLSAR